jgi:hypothetical protein
MLSVAPFFDHGEFPYDLTKKRRGILRQRPLDEANSGKAEASSWRIIMAKPMSLSDIYPAAQWFMLD